jgi:hypothetical protein
LSAAALESLTLDVPSHTYRVGRRIYPSVTQALSVIESYDRVPFEILERARIFGRHVHHACDLFNQGDLDEERLDPALAPRLAGYKKFLHETGFKVTRSEEMVLSPSLGYAGTLDIRGLLRSALALVDLKSGAVPRSVGPQTAAYQAAVPADERPKRRLCVQLKDYDYKIIECRDASDLSNFLSALNVYRFQRRNNPYVENNESGRAIDPAA